MVEQVDQWHGEVIRLLTSVRSIRDEYANAGIRVVKHKLLENLKGSMNGQQLNEPEFRKLVEQIELHSASLVDRNTPLASCSFLTDLLLTSSRVVSWTSDHANGAEGDKQAADLGYLVTAFKGLHDRKDQLRSMEGALTLAERLLSTLGHDSRTSDDNFGGKKVAEFAMKVSKDASQIISDWKIATVA